MSIRVFALVTLVGMIPPTLALTYSGSYVGSGTWLTVPLGLTMVALLLLIPTLALRYPNSRFVKLLQGKASVSTPVPIPLQIAMSTSAESTARCDSCQKPMEC